MSTKHISASIGSRWAPGEVLRRDTGSGVFEHINAVDLSNDSLILQQSLIYTPPPRRRVGIGAVLLVTVLAGAAFWVALWPWIAL